MRRARQASADDDGCAEDGLPLKSTGVRPGDQSTTGNARSRLRPICSEQSENTTPMPLSECVSVFENLYFTINGSTIME